MKGWGENGIRAAFGLVGRLGAVLAAGNLCAAEPVDFQRDVRPVLSRHCLKCHGPDVAARRGGFRLDERDQAIVPAKSGRTPIVPGKVAESELVRRIEAAEDEEVMPPPEAKNPLTAAQREVLRRWVASGAEYTPHWAFVAPRQAPLPAVGQRDWPRNPIDFFVLARLEEQGLEPAAEADPFALIRRVCLDLTGLPPGVEEVEQFLGDKTEGRYERLVDRLLASPAYGERWARLWLDLARYADTNGYEKDRPRSIWPYRDWVINALNADMPFDQFTIEQLAGDMLPGAAPSQRIATGFHRNTMVNEEGGIDPLEYRFYAMVDRVATTGTTWLGLTLGCAQCHSHKFDPIAQREYYQLMAFLNNCEEPEMELLEPGIEAERAALEKQIAALTAELPGRFPVPEWDWAVVAPGAVRSEAGSTARILEDGSVLVTGENPERDVYEVELISSLAGVTRLRLEALTDDALPQTGPGRTPHGNFVLTEIVVEAGPAEAGALLAPVKIVKALADHSQPGFGIEQAFDGQAKTGWAIAGATPLNQARTAIFDLERPVGGLGGTRWRLRLEQEHGGSHTLGKFRLSLARPIRDERPLEVRRQEALARAFAAWREREAARTARWERLRPTEAKSNLPWLTLLEDDSVLASGDMTKRDLYEVRFAPRLKGIRAVRLEVLPDNRLPRRGPGRVYYEGPAGDFFLSELTVWADGQPVRLSRASHSFANGPHTASAAMDGDPQTGWSIQGGQGRRHVAVFNLAAPLGETGDLEVKLLFERYHAAGLGRFRVWVTADEGEAAARDMPVEVEELLLAPEETWTAEQAARVREHFLLVTSELREARRELEQLRDRRPAYPTTLVLAERPPDHPRPTYIHHRGEFLRAGERVEPAVLSVLHPLAEGQPRNRLGFARWLVDPANPLVGRVTVNRAWAALFGRGLVRTVEDFGFQGELPTHPELLDWLAVDFVGQGWSLKKLHRLIVTSATYRQSSRVSPLLLERDPENRWLARGPRVRLEAEMVRDAALQAAGLLSRKVGGPSVFPPQPPGVTTEGAYGQLEWKVSAGEDRYRRGLYTFSKRTAPYAMFQTFDAGSGEKCVARREVSNTPLQALTMLNDTVLVEAAQALGKRMAERNGSVEERIRHLFQRCLTRPPEPAEMELLMRFYRAQQERFGRGDLQGEAIAGPGEGDAAERALWTVVARAILNLDEAITKG